MGEWLLILEINCADSSKEKEFKQWYENMHINDVMTIPGLISITRYENPSPVGKQGKYLALYEVETEDIIKTMVALNENMTRWGDRGRVPKFVEIVGGCFYRQIAAPVKKKEVEQRRAAGQHEALQGGGGTVT